jgi:hypothetical protein
MDRATTKLRWWALLALLVSRGACFAAQPPAASRVVVLLLPGAGLAGLTRADHPHLSETAHRSTGAWVAGWWSLEPPAGRALRLSAPLRPGQSAAAPAPVLWIDLGQGERRPGQTARNEALPAALATADDRVARYWADSHVRDLWIVAPPTHPGPGLTPFFWRRRGASSGLLSSGSTHMRGVVTGGDLAATLASLAGAPYTGGGCRLTAAPPADWPARGDQAEDPVPALRRLGVLADRTDAVRAVTNRVVQWLLLLLMAAGIAALRAGRRLSQPLALAPLALPPLLLLEGAWRGGAGVAEGVLLALLIGGGVLACFACGRTGLRTRPSPPAPLPTTGRGVPENGTLVRSPSPGSFRERGPEGEGPVPGAEGPWRLLAAVTLAACVLAVLAGDIFRWSILGYSIRLGVRFYGIGNEFMGWCIGAALLAVSAPREERVRPGALGLLLAVALLLGHPGLGGKVGGAITGLAAVAVEAWPRLRRHRALALALLALAVAALLGLAAWDASRPPELQTHLGRLALRTLAHGPRPFLTLAAGKLQTELRVTISLWGVLLVAGVWLVREARRHTRHADAIRAVARLLPVAAVAFLCNDSGVIAAALMLSYATIAAGPTGNLP